MHSGGVVIDDADQFELDSTAASDPDMEVTCRVGADHLHARHQMPAARPIFYSSRVSTWHKSLILFGVG